MRVVDSSAWVEWLIDSATGKRLAELIPRPEECIVPTIVQLEMCKWLRREKGEDQADRFLAYSMKCSVAPLDTVIAVMASDFARSHKLATADAIVYATTQHFRAALLTCDSHFRDLPSVILVDK